MRYALWRKGREKLRDGVSARYRLFPEKRHYLDSRLFAARNVNPFFDIRKKRVFETKLALMANGVYKPPRFFPRRGRIGKPSFREIADVAFKLFAVGDLAVVNAPVDLARGRKKPVGRRVFVRYFVIKLSYLVPLFRKLAFIPEVARVNDLSRRAGDGRTERAPS